MSLSYAVMNGYNTVAKHLLDTGKANINSKDQWGRTTLSWATRNAYKGVVKMLVTGKADVESKYSQGQTPLSLAALGTGTGLSSSCFSRLRPMSSRSTFKVGRRYHG
jgi:hypothetical protein